jgi:hypothetical protein
MPIFLYFPLRVKRFLLRFGMRQIRPEHVETAGRKHDLAGPWSNMLSRCFDPESQHYHRYGGRGITVCDWWLTFDNFADDMGPRPPGCDLHRKDNDRDYEPGNCVWLPHSEHMRLPKGRRVAR